MKRKSDDDDNVMMMDIKKESMCPVSAWQQGVEKTHSAQCSTVGEYCFLCYHEDDDTNDDIKQLHANIKVMVRAGKELPVIVKCVQVYYNENIREFVKDVIHLDTKQPIGDAPEWSLSSIERHLIYGKFCSEVFNNVIEDQFKAHIMHFNARMIDGRTGDVIPDAHKMWMETVMAYKKWKKN